MPVEKTEVLVVGAGQAGVAMSSHLTASGVPHIVLERDRIAERWRSCRWDSLVANGPAWHDRFPGLEFSGTSPDGFVPKDGIADYMEAYARQTGAPVRCGVEVSEVTRNNDHAGFRVETSGGVIEADYVVAATGPFQSPIIPPVVPDTAGITQIHSADYKNPSGIPEGAVLVVGSGASGSQIAEELQHAGRSVFLSVGPHDRPARSYRGRDFVWWLGVLNKWDAEATPGAEHITIAVSGADGGHTIDFRKFAEKGITLLGRTESFHDGVLNFAPDLAENLIKGDASYLSMLGEADTYIARNGLDLPEEPEAHHILPDPECVKSPIRSLDLKKANIRTVIWATGFGADYSWLKVDALDENGRPRHERGVSSEPGVYFLGLPWQTRRGSSFIWGVWQDAKYVADHITRQRSYLVYRPAGDSPAQL
ncbi:flavin-containing monooxygenase [Acetobacter oeni]|uniref:FAD-dependent oxidoreductase n=1 Tax=Acetobacter oeni TaxID=304077 RepID=A0A511XQL9_9PROT|nr:NAD(P)/FAD-dependent oxidoreductase [Acetobacter oeni]MBB3884831.1 putative flavoprotein involved in K+ transport [Acetobacter oeni]NHO20769.1 SidA/IucD/PvdA family monooxygenase [Acetobacter oeni]GBR03412.1 flavin-containing monooxygenase [Acetobacter oeni LMG 21952]GEN65209.1 FAD-dependent oxidoreductase [Acetobacter oeni]